MKKVSKNERRRRLSKKKRGGFYFQFNYDKAKKRRKGVTKDFYNSLIEKKYGGGKKEFMAYPPEKMTRKLKNVQTGKFEEVEMDRCCAQVVGSDPPKRCRKPAIKGQMFCRSHGGEMIRTNKEREVLRYSEEELRQQIEELTRGDLLDIKEEIAVTIIVMRKHIERMLKNVSDKGFNYKDVEMFTKLVDSATKQVLRLDRLKYGKDIVTKEKLEEALAERSRKELDVIDKLIKDDELKKNLLIAFSNIQSNVVL